MKLTVEHLSKSMGSCRPLLLLFTAMCLSRDHVIVTCIFAYLFILISFKFQGYKNSEVQNQDRIFLLLFYSLNFSPYSVIDGYLNSSCSVMYFFFCSPHFSFDGRGDKDKLARVHNMRRTFAIIIRTARPLV